MPAVAAHCPVGSLLLHYDSKAGIRAVQEASPCSWGWRHICLAPAQSSIQASSLRRARGKASPAESWIQGERSGAPYRWQVTPGLIRYLSKPHICTECCVCFALNAQCVTLQMCPSGYLWPYQELEACTHQPTTLLQDILVHHLLEQTGTFQGWRECPV